MSLRDDDDEVEYKGPIIFGKRVAEIPCFRNSWLYGISTGIVSGLLTFMGTSRPMLASNVGFYGFFGTTLTYWFYCRYNYFQEKKVTDQLQQLMKEQIMLEGVTPQSDKEEVEIVTLNNKMR